MNKIILMIFLLCCSKNINGLTNKNKINENYWQYIMEDRGEELKEYLENNKIDVNEEKNKEGETALTFATKLNKKNIVKLLLEIEEIDVNARNGLGKTALVIAILDNKQRTGIQGLKRYEIISELLNGGADINLNYGIASNNILMLAIIKEDTNTVKKILENGININAKNLKEECALILAIKSNIIEDKKIEIINNLLKHKDININLQDKQGKSALTHAVIKNNCKIVDILIKRKGIDINILDKKNMTPLDYLNFEDFEIELVMSLITNDAKLNNEEYFYDKSRKEYLEEIIRLLIEGKGNIKYEKESRNLLHWTITIFDNNMEISLKLAKYLIDKMKVNLNKIKEYIKYANKRSSDLFNLMQLLNIKRNLIYENPFLIKLEGKEELIKRIIFKAIEKGHINILKDVYKNFSFNIKDILCSDELLIHAIYNSKKDIVKFLLKLKLDFNNEDTLKKEILLLAIEKEDMEVLETLLENIHKFKSDVLNEAFIFAVENKKKEAFKVLRRKVAIINFETVEKIFNLAKEKYDEETLEVLLSGEIELENEKLNEILEQAVENGNNKLLELLIKRGADINYKTCYYKDPLFFKAAKKGHKHILELLTAKGANINDVNAYGVTVLRKAIEENNKEVFEILLNLEAKFSKKTLDTALRTAKEKGNQEMIKLLIAKGAKCNSTNLDKNAYEEDISHIAGMFVEYNSNYRKELIDQNEIIKIKDLNELLMGAVKEDKKDRVIEFIKNGASINYDDEIETVLTKAVKKGNKEILMILIEKELNIEYENLLKALKTAAFINNKEVFEILIKKFVIKKEDLKKDLNEVLSVGINNEEIVEVLLKEEFDISDHMLETIIMKARKSERLIENLLKRTQEIKNVYLNKMLMATAFNSKKDVVSLLLEKGADINYKEEDQYGKTPLIVAIENNNKDVVELLLEKEAKIYYKTFFIGNSKTVLALAVEKSNKDMVELLLNKSDRFNTEELNEVLILAIEKQNKEIVELLIEKGANVNYEDNFRKGALIKAFEGDSREIVELLIGKGACISEKYKIKETLSLKDNYIELAKILIEKGADINSSRIKLFINAVKDKNKELIELLIEKGADINNTPFGEEMPLILAVKQGNKEIVKLLLEKGANINNAPFGEDVPLILAVKQNNKEIMKILIEKRADVNITDKDENTALILAVKQNNKEIVELLIEQGTDVNSKNREGHTALIIASQYEHAKILELLVKKGADINIKDNYNMTALILAVKQGNKEIVELLLEKEADIDSKNYNEETALILAINQQNEEIKTLLLGKIKFKHKNDLRFVLILYATKLKPFKSLSIEDAVLFKYILQEMLKENKVLYKNIERINNFENKEDLKEELKNKIKSLKSLLKLPPELFELIMKFIAH